MTQICSLHFYCNIHRYFYISRNHEHISPLFAIFVNLFLLCFTMNYFVINILWRCSVSRSNLRKLINITNCWRYLGCVLSRIFVIFKIFQWSVKDQMILFSNFNQILFNIYNINKLKDEIHSIIKMWRNILTPTEISLYRKNCLQQYDS